MSQILHLATTSDLDRLERMVAAYHTFEDIESDEAHRRAALEPLLEGSPHGAVWLIGPKMAPVGYIAISFGWSIEHGGLDGVLDEFWIREAVRRRGMGGDALVALQKTLKAAGVVALSLEVDRGNDSALRLYKRAGFKPRDDQFMTWTA
jgi:ribosomal protein S18 acetylase RimI-like enzyme